MIKIHKTGKEIPASSEKSLMECLLDAGLPVASSCGGEGICGKCKIKIIAGGDQLTPPSESEIFLRQKNVTKENERFSCQTFLKGNCEVDASYW